MLTPDYLNLIEFNDVVELYNKLNIDITADIIERISQMQDITTTSKEQLKILLQTNGDDIFNQALEETAMLTEETKKALKELFEDMAKEDMQGYQELYEYRNKPFKLSATQYKILNEGLKQTNKTLRNFTNTIAFQSKQMYIQAVDNAYMKVVTGAFDYTTAIHQAVQQLADKGITLKDKLGRNVQLEVAVRRNVMSGIQKTANNINRNIEDELGCDGYEVTAHMGARPTHAEAQGKQYAVKHNTKISKQYPLWKDVEDLWEEYNCRHSYFGIILGISEPVYSNKELKKMKDATVTLNGKKVAYYDATQKQRELENNIRKTKRTVEILEKAELNSTNEKIALRQLQKELTIFCNETGLEKDYSRTKVANVSKTQINRLPAKTKDDIIESKIKEVYGRPNAKVEIKYKRPDIEVYSFDDKHINVEREHNTTKEDAMKFIEQSKVKITIWKGRYENYYSDIGVVYIDTEDKKIRSVYNKEEMYGDAVKIMEVYRDANKGLKR